MRQGGNILMVLLYLVLAVYFLNYPFQIMKIPQYISVADQWIIFIGGIFLVIGAVSFFRASRRFY
jgi:predicted membrane channel-forming protein YqfA (hemolysin III family)